VKKDPFSIDNLAKITKEDKKLLNDAEIYSAKDLVVRGPMNVSEATDIPIRTCNRICSSARLRLEELGVLNRPFTKPNNKEIERISFGSTILNSLLGGKGLHTGAITELFGESNSGKTQFCHMLSVMVQLDKHLGGLDGKALYIDTESTFTPERIGSIAEAQGLDRNKAVENIIPARVMSSIEQENCLEQGGSVMGQHKDIRLLVVDSVTGLYRAEYVGRAALPERQQRLYRHMLMLRRFSEVYGVAILITNQVNQAPEEFPGPFPKPIGGNVMAHASTFRIRLYQFGYLRRAELTHSSYLPENRACFEISKEGVYGMPDPLPLR
jgi:DNA repair protein RadA